MRRRDFLACAGAAGVAGACGPARGAQATAAFRLRDAVAIPAWAKREICLGLARYWAWKGEDETVAFPIVTDVHSRTGALPKDLSFADSKMHIFLAQHAAEEGMADFLADLGDIDLDMGSFKNGKRAAFCEKEQMEARLDAQVRIYEDCPCPVFFCVGNHDHSGGRYASAQFGARFNVGITQARGHALALGPDGSYGFYDIPAKKTRAIFLNSSDEGYYGYSVAQLAFFARSLATLPEGWTAFLLQHFCIQTVIGRWTSYPDTKAKRQEKVIAVMEDFVARRKGSADGVAWDFSGRKDARFAGCFFGDSHFDNYLRANGVDYSISQGYGTVQPKELTIVPTAVYTRFPRASQMLVDYVGIKPAKREVRIFRLGAGGPARDRGYVYGPSPA